MSLFRNMQIAANYNKQIDENMKKFADKRRLSNTMKTRIKTAFIGSLNQFEDMFGFLWGNGKNESELNENEKKWRSLWLQTRSKILYNGNSQIRLVDFDLSNFDINFLQGNRGKNEKENI